jgi:hypothetical protein
MPQVIDYIVYRNGGVAHQRRRGRKGDTSMPQVIDAPEAVQGERWHQDEAKTAPQLAITASQRPRPGFLAAVWSAVTSLTARHPRPQPYVTHTPQQLELPIERVAREHPFLIIVGMSGLS